MKTKYYYISLFLLTLMAFSSCTLSLDEPEMEVDNDEEVNYGDGITEPRHEFTEFGESVYQYNPDVWIIDERYLPYIISTETDTTGVTKTYFTSNIPAELIPGIGYKVASPLEDVFMDGLADVVRVVERCATGFCMISDKTGLDDIFKVLECSVDAFVVPDSNAVDTRSGAGQPTAFKAVGAKRYLGKNTRVVDDQDEYDEEWPISQKCYLRYASDNFKWDLDNRKFNLFTPDEWSLKQAIKNMATNFTKIQGSISGDYDFYISQNLSHRIKGTFSKSKGADFSLDTMIEYWYGVIGTQKVGIKISVPIVGNTGMSVEADDFFQKSEFDGSENYLFPTKEISVPFKLMGIPCRIDVGYAASADFYLIGSSSDVIHWEHKGKMHCKFSGSKVPNTSKGGNGDFTKPQKTGLRSENVGEIKSGLRFNVSGSIAFNIALKKTALSAVIDPSFTVVGFTADANMRFKLVNRSLSINTLEIPYPEKVTLIRDDFSQFSVDASVLVSAEVAKLSLGSGDSPLGKVFGWLFGSQDFAAVSEPVFYNNWPIYHNSIHPGIEPFAKFEKIADDDDYQVSQYSAHCKTGENWQLGYNDTDEKFGKVRMFVFDYQQRYLQELDPVGDPTFEYDKEYWFENFDFYEDDDDSFYIVAAYMSEDGKTGYFDTPKLIKSGGVSYSADIEPVNILDPTTWEKYEQAKEYGREQLYGIDCRLRFREPGETRIYLDFEVYDKDGKKINQTVSVPVQNKNPATNQKKNLLVIANCNGEIPARIDYAIKTPFGKIRQLGSVQIESSDPDEWEVFSHDTEPVWKSQGYDIHWRMK